MGQTAHFVCSVPWLCVPQSHCTGGSGLQLSPRPRSPSSSFPSSCGEAATRDWLPPSPEVSAPLLLRSSRFVTLPEWARLIARAARACCCCRADSWVTWAVPGFGASRVHFSAMLSRISRVGARLLREARAERRAGWYRLLSSCSFAPLSIIGHCSGMRWKFVKIHVILWLCRMLSFLLSL
jgi:hypothetical protein